MTEFESLLLARLAEWITSKPEPTIAMSLNEASSVLIPSRPHCPDHLAGATGLEPAASCVTTRRFTHLNSTASTAKTVVPLQL